jgi:hypothetical protein
LAALGKEPPKWRKPVETSNQEIFAFCNNLQTVCEQSATVLASRSRVQQFVNKVQQIATMATPKNGSQTAKTP